ncbi:hypothetical protein GGQ61_003269 [Phenylobacterium haematophilum]|jgi:hypothetical protein|uniref:Uncharacterized protein n=1 Tax=Phenylobacterium haematophilum TaxID=98513 RepID=A0A840A4D6_9CAUL|nr:hypothetical protein [Phenylobacterium haematophilum]MBB3892533.1 hypothetical protein [Phenylobacterium haematophilum]
MLTAGRRHHLDQPGLALAGGRVVERAVERLDAFLGRLAKAA